MYNTIIIIVCAFSVFGVYSLLRMLSVAFSKEKSCFIAVKPKEDGNVGEQLLLAEYYAQESSFLCGKPVILFDGDLTEETIKCGYDVYIKIPERRSYDNG